MAAVITGQAAATDVYVDAVNGDTSYNGLSLGAAKKTITQGVALAKSLGGARVRIQEGTYDVNLGEAFPIVLDVHDIAIYGDETNEANWPRIGGDINDTNKTALFQVNATGGNLDDIAFTRLYFLGEDTASKDAPSAIEALVSGGYSLLRIGVQDCVFERSEMNASGAAGRATIRLDMGSSASAPFFIRDSEIWASEKGGVEVLLNAVDEADGQPIVTIDGCSILIEGTDDAEFGVFCGGGTDVHGQMTLKLLGTTIDSTGVSSSSYGIETGVDIWLNATDENSVQLLESGTAIQGSEIKGCKGDGVRIRLNEAEGANANAAIQSSQFFLNKIHDNGGAGVHLDWSDEDGYIAFRSSNCLFVDNLYGIWFDNFSETITGQLGTCTNDTIANNSSFGLCLDGTFESSGSAPSPNLVNCIVWGNNSSGCQSGGSASWDPVSDGGMSYSDWQGLPNADCSAADSNNNIDCDPDFVNAGSGDYHLVSMSKCIDAGNSFPTAGLPSLDIDREDRTQNGDGQGGSEVDMGVDEYSP